MINFIKIIIILGIVFALLFAWAGFFRPVEFNVNDVQKRYAVYAVHKGSYAKSDVTIREVEKFLNSQGIFADVSFGLYFQNPKDVPTELLTSWVGYVVNDPIETTAPFYLLEIPVGKKVVTEFIGHPMISSFKIYPKLMEYLKLYNYKQDTKIYEFYTKKSLGQYLINIEADVVAGE